MSHDFDQSALPAHESETKRPKRQRLDSTVAPDQHAHPTLTLHPAKSHVDAAGGYVVSTYTTQSFADTQQLEIYYAWHQAGSPHNYVCYECRKPYNLICCTTCCRAYHVDCLSRKPAETAPADAHKEPEWHCDACKRRKWDINPPLSHEGPHHPGLHPSQNSRSHSWAATSNRLEAPSRKLQSFSEGHYPRRSSKLRHISDASAVAVAVTATTDEIFDAPHPHPHPHPHSFVPRPREDSRISEGDEAAAEAEVDTTAAAAAVVAVAQPAPHPLHERPIPTLVVERPPDDDSLIAKMRAEIESLRHELATKHREVRELEDLRRENAVLKSRMESLEPSSAMAGVATGTGSAL